MKKDYESEGWVIDKEPELKDDEKSGFDSWIVHHTATGGHTSNEIKVRLYRAGGMSIVGENDMFAYLTLEQQVFLTRFLVENE